MRLIDADALIAKFEDDIKYFETMEKGYEAILTIGAVNTVKHQPTVDAVPVRHGHWIFNPKDAIEMMFTLPKCSECGAESTDGGNYCPNCGARMDGE